MQNARLPVKLTLVLVCVMVGGGSLFSSTSFAIDAFKEPLARPQASDALSLQFLSQPDYLGQALQLGPFEALRAQIETQLGEHLNSRGEAHITVLAPAEWSLLQQKITAAEIEKIATDANIQQNSFEAVCIGRGQKKEKTHTLKNYFVVIKSPGLLQIRHQLADLYKSRQDKNQKDKFDPDHYYPHVTLGFTDRDLHESDGVIKNEKSCIQKWTTL